MELTTPKSTMRAGKTENSLESRLKHFFRIKFRILQAKYPQVTISKKITSKTENPNADVFTRTSGSLDRLAVD